MASPKNVTAAKQYLAEVLELLPEEARAAVRAQFVDAEDAAEALDRLGQGVLRQQDYSRLADEANRTKTRNEQYYEQLIGWKAKAERELQEEMARLQVGNPDPDDDDDPPTRGRKPKKPAVPDGFDPAKFVTLEAHQQALSNLGREALGLFALQQKMALQHYQTFGEILDFGELYADPAAQTDGLEAIYQKKYADRYAQLHADKSKQEREVLEADIRKRVTEELQEKYQGFIPALPPDQTTSVLAGLTQEAGDKNPARDAAQVDQLTAEYNRLVASGS